MGDDTAFATQRQGDPPTAAVRYCPVCGSPFARPECKRCTPGEVSEEERTKLSDAAFTFDLDRDRRFEWVGPDVWNESESSPAALLQPSVEGSAACEREPPAAPAKAADNMALRSPEGHHDRFGVFWSIGLFLLAFPALILAVIISGIVAELLPWVAVVVVVIAAILTLVSAAWTLIQSAVGMLAGRS